MTAQEKKERQKKTMSNEVCSVDDSNHAFMHDCSGCDAPLCEEHTETDFVPERPNYYCQGCYEAWNRSLQDGKVGEAGAIFAFMGWLTSRNEVSGPFSARHEASQAANLVAWFCETQGWEIKDDNWHRHIKPYKETQ